MSRRTRIATVAAAALALGAAGLVSFVGWGAAPSRPADEGPAETAPAPPPPAQGERAETPPPAPAPEREPPPADLEALEERLAETDRPAEAERLRERVREVVRREEAKARWDEGVSGESLEARHLEPSVRRLFEELELEPVLREGGLMEGLAVQGVAEDGAAARAGLAPGDVIVSLDGEELEDPRALPGLLARLSRPLPLCVTRGGSRRCMELELD